MEKIEKGYCPTCGNYVCNEEYDETEDWSEQDWKDYYDELREQELEARIDMALSCTCGAWHVTKDNKVIHSADCICGAE